MQVSISKTKFIALLILTVFMLPFVILPLTASSAEIFPTLVPCDSPSAFKSVTNSDGSVTQVPVKGGCGYSAFIELINNVLKFVIGIATVIAVVMFTYAGILLVTSGGNKEKMTMAKNILRNVTIGFVIVVSAWLIIFTIVDKLTGGNAPKPLRAVGVLDLIQKEHV